MKVVYHPLVPRDVRRAVAYYAGVSETLASDFWQELLRRIEAASEHPTRFHFDASGLRRCNLKRFPYHFLFYEKPDHIRVTVVRHHKRHPSYGTGRR